jgi:ubiquinone biosynthesis protein
MGTTRHHRRSEYDTTGEAVAGIFATVADVADASLTLVSNVVGHVERLVDDVARDAGGVAREVGDLWSVTSARAATLTSAVRAAPRFTRVVGEILRIVAAYRWQAAMSDMRADVLGAETDAAALAALHARSARRLYELCVELRGGVLKLGQFASTRMDLLPDAYVAGLSRLQDRVPPVPFAAIAERVASALDAPIDAVFSRFDAEPIAAASLAQVHAAVLADGTPVVVKVQVPGVDELVEADLAALRVVAPVLQDLVPFIDLRTVAGELSRAVRAELDYVAEARHATAFATAFAGDVDVVVPRVFDACSSAEVLVFEHIRGERLTDYLDGCEGRGEAGARDRDRLFEILVRCFCTQVLEHGLLHADPHPGNFLVVSGADGPRLALLDFGCVQPYSAARRTAYAQLGLAVLTGDGARLAELFEAMGFRSRDGSPDTLRAFADLLLAAFRSDSASAVRDLDPRAAFEQVLHLTRDNPIVAIPGDFVLLGRVFAALGGLLMRYQPRLNLFRILMPLLARAVTDPTSPPCTAA